MSPGTRDDIAGLLMSVRRGEAASLEQLAAKAHLSRFHLSRLCQEQLGFPLRDFLAATRVDRGIEVLLDGHQVTRSQVEAGHESASSYHRAFVRHTGMSPSRFRTQMGALAAHLMRHQDDSSTALAAVHRTFRPEDHPQPHALTLRVDGAAPKGALFVALHPEPIVRGEPLLGIAMLGTSEHLVTAIPDGTYYPMVVEVPRAADPRAYFQMSTNRRQLCRAPVTFPLERPTTVPLALRELLPTDPPITLNLPKLFLDAVSGRIDLRSATQDKWAAPRTD
ncbi:helix-turn-helix domain-containing protein [Ornithinimicrobium pratense]|uniref:Helix-turn-helix domain-containing protein n=1 Tax=Ornithinimicrobium pratense TaxID=2593973 RepID=A0A5J6V736_9MICO|nr:helix-turn-helix domain-containing protein [Ornithinimicrobium pratense]QFG68862.1 helix-turn-helix domain-containing protein [Ornithinimicrobium pratense]